MKICKRWLCLITVLVTFHKIDAAIPFKKVALATSTKSTTTATTTTTSTTTTINATPSEEASLNSEDENRSDNATTLKNSKLTGIPQIDYIWDPNLPRELRGYNLSSYPFFASVPPEEDIHFKCDGLHDGFYASIEHKCQLYHHCVYGIRHDFLCANFTAFDQKTFICHFVSDVDCEGSQKYWNRNDDLYMATTTTSTTTTTTEPPPTTPRKKLSRPLRPLRRPINHRRPIDDDYYYDEEDYEYDDDYYEEILKRRRKQRPRHRKPLIDYEDDYEDAKRSIDIKPRRNYSRDQIRETDMQSEDDDYETEHRKVERPKIRHKPTPLSERRKINSRKSSSVQGHSNVEDRRPTNEEKPIPRHKKVSAVIPDDFNEPNEHVPRRPTNRRRITGRRFSSSSTVNDTEDVDDDKTHGHETDVGETGLTPEEEEPTKAKTKSKTLEELITPKAAPTSVYARPRTPPRIARPVPINEKKKFQYPVQKSATIPYKHEASQEDTLDYYEEDEDYDDIRRHRGSSRRRPVGETKPRDDIDDDEPPLSGTRRRKAKPARTLRKPVVVNKKTVTTTIKTTSTVNDDEDDYDTDESYVGRSGHRRRNNYTGRTNSKYDVTEDVDFVDEDYEDRPLKRPKVNSRNSQRKPSPSPETEAEFDESEEDVSEKKLQRSRTPTNAGRRTRPASGLTRMRPHTPQTVSDETNSEQTDEVDYSPSGPGKSLTATSNHRSTAVRIVKRPFLPSRGGSPYLPRGLQPVGIAIKPIDATSTTTTDRNQGAPHINMGSTISGVHLLEHGAPLLRESAPPRTTLPPRSPLPLSKSQSVLSAPEIPSKATLDELYETDYDVTLNDALNPTLKPLSPHQPLHLQQFQPQQYNYQTNQTSNSKNNNRSYSNGIYLASPQSDISFLHHRNNQSPSSSVIIDHHVHHQLLPSSSPSLPLLSHHHPSSSSVQRQLQTQSYHFHNAPKQQKLLRQEQSINNDHNDNNDNYNSDTYFSSTDIRQQAIASAPSQAESNRHIDTATNNSTIPRHPQEHHPQQQQQQQQQSFYEDYEYY